MIQFCIQQKPGVSDAFLTLQVGFVGAYGEWAYSKTLGFQQGFDTTDFYTLIKGLSIYVLTFVLLLNIQ